MNEELIKELKDIRARVTAIYIKLGNPRDCEADMLLGREIRVFEKRFVKDES